MTHSQPRPATIEEISDDDDEAFSDNEQEHNVRILAMDMVLIKLKHVAMDTDTQVS